MRSKTQRLSSLCWTAIALTLSACAYRGIDQDAAAADERASGIDDALESVTPGTAKLVFRSRGAGHSVNYAVSNSPSACQDFRSIGNVAYSGRGVVYPWIANMTERTRGAILKTQPFIQHEVDVKPGDTIQVRGLGHWDQNAGLYMRSGTCGPVVARFNPQADHAYLIDFVWGENLSCTQDVVDATVPYQPMPVQAEQLPGCE